MENPVVSSMKKKSSKSRSRSNTPVQRHFLSSTEDLDVPAMNTRSSSRNCFVVLEDNIYQKYRTSDYSSEDGDISPTSAQNIRNSEKENERNGHTEDHEKSQRDLLAYREYCEAGEYWNKYPKTDYTYSKRSPHRRELSGGSVALPNMSRPSLHSFDERMDKKYLAERIDYYDKCSVKNTYSTSAGTSSSTVRNRISKSTSYKDTELIDRDIDHGYFYNGSDVTDVTIEVENQSLLSRFWSKIVNMGRWTKSWFVEVEDTEIYRTPLNHRANFKQGFVSRTYTKGKNSLLWFLSQIYWLIGLVLMLDCKLLCGRETPPGSRKRGLILLLLLPLLLLGAWWFYLHPFEDIKTNVYELIHTSPQFIYDLATNFKNFILEIFNSPSTAFTNFCLYLYSCVVDLISHLLQTTSAMINILIDSIYQLPYLIYSFFNYLLQLFSYSLSLFAAFWYRAPDVKETMAASSHYQDLNTLSDPDFYHKIELYVDKYLKNNAGNYIKKTIISPEYLNIISKAIKENIHSMQENILDPDFITKLAMLIRKKLDENPQKLVLTTAHFKEIEDSLKNGEINFNFKNIDTSFLIQELIKSPLLQNYIIQSGSLNVDKAYLENQQNVLFDLEKQIRANNLDIEKLKKMHLDDAVVKLQNAVNRLQVQHDDLKQDLSKMRFDVSDSINNVKYEFKKILSDILGFDIESNPAGFKNWINEAFLAKDVLELKLSELRNTIRVESKSTVDASAAILMKHIGESIKSAMLRYKDEHEKMQMQLKKEISNDLNTIRHSQRNLELDVTGFDVQEIVRKALLKYDADKTGLVDYALESGGGQVLTTRCTETYSSRTAQYTFLNIPLWYSSNSPRTAITPGTQPGQCWAFQSFPGYLVIQLSMPIQVTGFTMEHVPKELVANGNIDSAPRNFSVWGLKTEQDQDPAFFGYFEYQLNGSSLQYFPVKPDDTNQHVFDIVELRVESNHGNPVFSCLYRFRVHGTPVSKVEKDKFKMR